MTISSVTVVPFAESAEARAALLDRTYQAAAPVLLPWFSEPVLRDSLAYELDHARNTINGASAESTSAHRRVDAARLIRLPGTPARWIVAQLQRQDQPQRLATITITHRSFNLMSESDVSATAHAARTALAEVIGDRPAAISVRRFETHADPLPNVGRVETTFVAAPIRRLHLPEPYRGETIRAIVPDSMDFYETYQSWYHEFWAQRPELVNQVPIETCEDLEACVEHDGLRLITVDGEICGLLAAIPSFELGMKGWRMREKVIAPSFWGRGVSAPATVIFAQSLPAAPDDAIWGTIVPANRASMRSARLIGRETVGSICRIR